MPKGRLLLGRTVRIWLRCRCEGRRKEPAYLVHTAEFVARLRGESQAELSEHTRSATEKTFGLPAQ